MPSQPALNKQPMFWLFIGIAIVIVVLDLWTKSFAVARLQFEGNLYSVIDGFFQFRLAYNKGAAFSFLYHAGGWQRWFFSAIAAVMSVVLIIWIWRVCATKKFESLGLALILGGAIGNLYDRVTLGYVVDFLDFYYQAYHFPAFNVADMGITCGAAILIWDSLFNQKKTNSQTSEAKS